VKDKQGKFIPGLTAQDFAITEDGAPQKITFCEHQALAANALRRCRSHHGQRRAEALQAPRSHPGHA
jgi:hypothetical protein